MTTFESSVSHVIDDSKNPVEALVWTMLCGEQCIAFPDGALAPDGFDFYGMEAAEKATCARCRQIARVDPGAHRSAESPRRAPHNPRPPKILAC